MNPDPNAPGTPDSFPGSSTPVASGWSASPLPAARDRWPDGTEPPPLVPPPRPAPRLRINWWLHGFLFVATAVSTTLTAGPLYGAAIMAILLAHEMGHYLLARHYRVPATPPYFIPLPLISLFGTMGAVIRMATLGANRKALFDIAVAGPIAGLVLAVPACLLGLSMSEVVTTANLDGFNINLGTSILFQWFSDLIFGKLPPGQEVLLHPIAFAGWAGLFVTSLNLLPIGQLDGGHVAYALLGRRAWWLALAMATGFLAMAIFVSREWLFLALLLFLFGIRHPPTADDTVPIGRGRIWLGVALLLLLVLTFTPEPFQN